MEVQFIYLIGTLLAVDLVVLAAWAVPYIAGVKIGYGWRKMLWLILAVRLLIPLRILMRGIYEQKPAYLWQIELLMEEAAGTGQSDLSEKTQEVTANARDGATAKISELAKNTGSEASVKVLETAENAEDNVNGKTIDTDADTEELSPSDRQQNAKIQLRMSDSLYQKTPDQKTSEYKTPDHKKLWLLLALWIAGAAVFSEYHVIGYLNIREWIRRYSRHCDDEQCCAQLAAVCEAYCMKKVPQIFICDKLSSPMLLGYRHTMLLMPDRAYTKEELYMIFCHEMQHKRNGDLWYKLLIMFVCDLYWFNPVMRLMEKLAYQDVECVCDTLVMRRLSAEEQKRYGMTVLQNMAENRVRDIVYGTSIFTGKRAAKRRIQHMFVMKNRWGYLVMGILITAVLAGSSMWVIAGQERAAKDENAAQQIKKMPEADAASEQQIGDPVADTQTIPQEESAAMPVFRVSDMDIIRRKPSFELADYYITNKVIVDNRYFIDENKVLWGYGKNEYGQLGLGKGNIEDFYQEPVKIAEHVVTVDCSVNGYFCVYLTEDGRLYGIGSNRVGLFGEVQDGAEPVLLMENVAYVRAGMECIAALDRDQNVWWWGQYCGTYHSNVCDSRDYEKSTEDDHNPAKMLYTRPRKLLENCIYVTTGNTTGAAIGADGSLYTWGRNLFGECGTPVTGDDFVRTPQKVLDDVSMVWVEEIAGNSQAQEIPRLGRYDTSYDFNVFAQFADGTMVGAGKDLGVQERTLCVTGDLLETSTHRYSDTFVPILLEEYDEPQIRGRLTGLSWGMDAVSVQEYLTRNRVAYFDVYEEYSNTGVHTKRFDEKYVIVAENNRYRLTFDETGCLDGIMIQEGGGSRNNRFTVGMSMEEVRAQFSSDFTCEETEWDVIYWADEILDGNRYGFEFKEGALWIIYERAA